MPNSATFVASRCLGLTFTRVVVRKYKILLTIFMTIVAKGFIAMFLKFLGFRFQIRNLGGISLRNHSSYRASLNIG